MNLQKQELKKLHNKYQLHLLKKISEQYSNKVSDPYSQQFQLYLRLAYQNKQSNKTLLLNVKQCHRMMRRHYALLKTELL